MKKLLLILTCTLLPALGFAQLPAHLEGRMEYPVFDFHPWVGVVKTKAKKLDYDKDLNYKIAIDITDGITDSTQVMGTLLEVARTYNLNIANGVPKRKLEMAVVLHGGAIQGLLKNEAYLKKFGVPNPNIQAIEIMKKAGVEFYVCAQVLAFRQVPEEDIIDEVEITLSAKTALITLQQMGYTYMRITNN
ncbi:MAG: DsrE family protein [Cytophagia bacterium]|nr:DsrE family protein [Cytophagia bacterium]